MELSERSRVRSRPGPAPADGPAAAACWPRVAREGPGACRRGAAPGCAMHPCTHACTHACAHAPVFCDARSHSSRSPAHAIAVLPLQLSVLAVRNGAVASLAHSLRRLPPKTSFRALGCAMSAWNLKPPGSSSRSTRPSCRPAPITARVCPPQPNPAPHPARTTLPRCEARWPGCPPSWARCTSTATPASPPAWWQ